MEPLLEKGSSDRLGMLYKCSNLDHSKHHRILNKYQLDIECQNQYRGWKRNSQQRRSGKIQRQRLTINTKYKQRFRQKHKRIQQGTEYKHFDLQANKYHGNKITSLAWLYPGIGSPQDNSCNFRCHLNSKFQLDKRFTRFQLNWYLLLDSSNLQHREYMQLNLSQSHTFLFSLHSLFRD